MYEANMGTHMYRRHGPCTHAMLFFCPLYRVIFSLTTLMAATSTPRKYMGNENAAAGHGMPAVENQLFNIKFTAKQIHRMSKKCEKEHTQELTKVKKAMEKGDAESAR